MTTPSDPSKQPPPLPAGRMSGPEHGWMEAGGEWRRQHPAALLLNILQSLRGMIFPIIAAVVAARGWFLLIILGIIFSISTGIAVLRYWRYRYRFSDHELVVEQGWLYRQVRHISYVRIQNINITKNVLHRVFGVAGMQLESASGSEPEAVMDAISPSALDELHDRVEQAKEEGAPVNGSVAEVAEPTGEERKEILRLGIGELVRHGLVSNRGMVLVAAFLGYLFQGPLGEQFFPFLISQIARFTDRPPTEIVEAMGPGAWFLVGTSVFLVILLVLAFLSVIYAIIRFYGFSLQVGPKSVRAEYGLFTRVAITIPRRRIQLIGFRANPFHRLLGRVSLKVETAGLTGGEGRPSSLRWLAPILPREDAVRVLQEVQPEVDWAAFDWQPLHPRARARLLRIRLMLLGVVVAVLAFFAGVPALFLLLLIPLVFAYARGYFRYAAWATGERAVAFRSGWLVRQQSVVRYPKIQVVSLSRNPFDRRWGMATVNVDTAGADPTGHSVLIRFMDAESAASLRNLLEEKTRETQFVWG